MAILAVLATSGRAAAGQAATPGPVAPAVVIRDAENRATLRAVRVEPLHIDGALDEALYRDVQPISGFVQVEPKAGAPATEETHTWVAFDDDNLYLAFRIWDSQPERRVATEMRRDINNFINGNDVIAVFIDTFHDRRNGVFFAANSIGARQDGQQVGTQYNPDWNPIWTHAVGKFEGGWTVEMALPFRSLRYAPGRAQTWGLNVLRTIRWKNEFSVLTPVPPARGINSLLAAQLAAPVVGIDAPAAALNLDIKPYGVTTLTSNVNATPRISNDVGGDVGLDVKYGVTQNMTADFTLNTDFAQVEADEQQVNLTRFSLFFPEKRDFFLENRDTFTFGGVTTGSGEAPVLFYSRRIGLDAGRPIPIDGGARLTGRVGRYTVGALNIQTDDEAGIPGSNFSVLRVKRDVLRQSSLGMLATRRSVAQSGGPSLAIGVDSALNFFNDIAINSYWARTEAQRGNGDGISYRSNMTLNHDRYGGQLERMRIDEGFNPEVGFVRRPDIRRSLAEFRFSPRPRRIRSVRRFWGMGTVDYFENGAGRLDARKRSGEFAIEFQNNDRLGISFIDTYEFLPRPFRIASNVTLPVGGYEWQNVKLAFDMRPQRRLAAQLALEHGTFYNGDRTALTIARGRVAVNPHLSLEPTYTLNHVTLTQGAFTQHLAGSRITYTMSPTMFTSALVQFNSATNAMTANVRLRWEYQPGSELFVVYNDERDTRPSGFPALSTRALIVKFNRLFRF